MIIEGFTSDEVKTAQKVIDLKDRTIHPDGKFDHQKRWHPDVETESSSEIREPSRAFPFTKMSHCRTAKYQAQLVGLDHKRIAKVVRKLRKELNE